MARNELNEQALAHVIQLPAHLKNLQLARTGSRGFKLRKISETLRIINRDQALEYAKEEFEREFGPHKSCKPVLYTQLKEHKLKLRMIEDDGKIVIWANESQEAVRATAKARR